MDLLHTYMKNSHKILILAIAALMTLCVAKAEAKPKASKVYIFGISISLTDSTTYLTDIQTFDTAYIDTKTGFLYDRSIYSQQLQIWVEYAKGRPNTTCAVFFHTNKSKLEKKYVNIRKKHSKDPSTRLKSLDAGEFKFIPQEWSEHETL